MIWQGQVLRGTDRLPPADLHYAWHVLKLQEWPVGTSQRDYEDSIRQIILDPASGMFVGQYRGTWQLGAARKSGNLRGPGGHDWTLIEYRVATGHWVTAYQPHDPIDVVLQDATRERVQWLRRPDRN